MKIIAADDHVLFRDTLTDYIHRWKKDVQVLTASDFYQAEDLLERETDVSLVLLDFRMPGMEGLSGIEKVISRFPGIPVVMMSGLVECTDVQRAKDMGAAGYFPKTMSGKSMMAAIKSVMEGERVFPTESGSDLYQPSHYYSYGAGKSTGAGKPGHSAPEPSLTDEPQQHRPQNIPLTAREKDVLYELLQGASNKEIANTLGLEVVTVKLHLRGVFKKLGVHNRTQAALTARERGIDQDIIAHIQSRQDSSTAGGENKED